MSDDEALALITINPAKQLGVEDRIGSLEEGKEGDVAIFRNHPLSVYAVPVRTIIDGVVYFDIDKDPSDIRVSIDPDNLPTFQQYTEEDRCMDGVFEYLFENR